MDKTDEIIAYVVHRLGVVRGRMLLAKLVYLVDLESRGWLGRPISTLTYVRDYGGPYDRSFEEHTGHLGGVVTVTLEPVYDYHVIVHQARGAFPCVSLLPSERLVADRVISQYGALGRRELVEDIVYETEPWRKAVRERLPVHAPLDMDSQNLALKRKYGIDMEQAAASLADRDAGRMMDVAELLH